MEISGRAILCASARLSDSFPQAVGLIASHSGKIAITGVGKSGRIAEKLAATFSSTGSPAVFVHAGEALHGDSGVVAAGDPLIAVSKKWQLAGIITARRHARQDLARHCDRWRSEIAIGLSRGRRAERGSRSRSDPYDLGAVGLEQRGAGARPCAGDRGDDEEGSDPRQFAERHPDGDLGRLLTRTVRESMLPCSEIARVTPGAMLREVLIEMTKWPAGAACVVDGGDGLLQGLITDGDIRRSLERIRHPHGCRGGCDVEEPDFGSPEATLFEAAWLMENRPRQLSVLPVVRGRRGG